MTSGDSRLVRETDPARLQRGMFTSATAEWGTPVEFFAQLHDEFRFTLDVCATPNNAKVPAFYSEAQDGLSRPWHGVCWMNPPYGRHIGTWIEKAYRSSREGATVVCLIPVRSDTAYWHEFVMRADEIRLVRGRLNFDGDKGSPGSHNAPFPCAVVVFRPHPAGERPSLSSIGRTAAESADSTEENAA